jgi:hypothetical protein
VGKVQKQNTSGLVSANIPEASAWPYETPNVLFADFSRPSSMSQRPTNLKREFLEKASA